MKIDLHCDVRCRLMRFQRLEGFQGSSNATLAHLSTYRQNKEQSLSGLAECGVWMSLTHTHAHTPTQAQLCPLAAVSDLHARAIVFHWQAVCLPTWSLQMRVRRVCEFELYKYLKVYKCMYVSAYEHMLVSALISFASSSLHSIIHSLILYGTSFYTKNKNKNKKHL